MGCDTKRPQGERDIRSLNTVKKMGFIEKQRGPPDNEGHLKKGGTGRKEALGEEKNLRRTGWERTTGKKGDSKS
jgi:hypothetical protein